MCNNKFICCTKGVTNTPWFLRILLLIKWAPGGSLLNMLTPTTPSKFLIVIVVLILKLGTTSWYLYLAKLYCKILVNWVFVYSHFYYKNNASFSSRKSIISVFNWPTFIYYNDHLYELSHYWTIQYKYNCISKCLNLN